jgi:hypothetical protein
MKNIIKVLKVVGLMLIITFTLASCKTPEEKANEKTKAELEGTWVNVEEDSSYKTEITYTFSNGTYEHQYQWTYKSPPVTSTDKEKGTYTVSGSLLTMTVTHVWGPIGEFGFNEEKWYSIAEMIQASKDAGKWTAEMEKNLNEEVTQTKPFSVSGNTLYIGDEKYTRK